MAPGSSRNAVTVSSDEDEAQIISSNNGGTSKKRQRAETGSGHSQSGDKSAVPKRPRLGQGEAPVEPQKKTVTANPGFFTDKGSVPMTSQRSVGTRKVKRTNEEKARQTNVFTDPSVLRTASAPMPKKSKTADKKQPSSISAASKSLPSKSTSASAGPSTKRTNKLNSQAQKPSSDDIIEISDSDPGPSAISRKSSVKKAKAPAPDDVIELSDDEPSPVTLRKSKSTSALNSGSKRGSKQPAKTTDSAKTSSPEIIILVDSDDEVPSNDMPSASTKGKARSISDTYVKVEKSPIELTSQSVGESSETGRVEPVPIQPVIETVAPTSLEKEGVEPPQEPPPILAHESMDIDMDYPPALDMDVDPPDQPLFLPSPERPSGPSIPIPPSPSPSPPTEPPSISRTESAPAGPSTSETSKAETVKPSSPLLEGNLQRSTSAPVPPAASQDSGEMVTSSPAISAAPSTVSLTEPAPAISPGAQLSPQLPGHRSKVSTSPATASRPTNSSFTPPDRVRPSLPKSLSQGATQATSPNTEPTKTKKASLPGPIVPSSTSTSSSSSQSSIHSLGHGPPVHKPTLPKFSSSTTDPSLPAMPKKVRPSLPKASPVKQHSARKRTQSMPGKPSSSHKPSLPRLPTSPTETTSSSEESKSEESSAPPETSARRRLPVLSQKPASHPKATAPSEVALPGRSRPSLPTVPRKSSSATSQESSSPGPASPSQVTARKPLANLPSVSQKLHSQTARKTTGSIQKKPPSTTGRTAGKEEFMDFRKMDSTPQKVMVTTVSGSSSVKRENESKKEQALHDSKPASSASQALNRVKPISSASSKQSHRSSGSELSSLSSKQHMSATTPSFPSLADALNEAGRANGLISSGSAARRQSGSLAEVLGEALHFNSALHKPRAGSASSPHSTASSSTALSLSRPAGSRPPPTRPPSSSSSRKAKIKEVIEDVPAPAPLPAVDMIDLTASPAPTINSEELDEERQQERLAEEAEILRQLGLDDSAPNSIYTSEELHLPLPFSSAAAELEAGNKRSDVVTPLTSLTSAAAELSISSRAPTLPTAPSEFVSRDPVSRASSESTPPSEPGGTPRNQSVSSASSATKPAKRGPGRPRKHPIPSSEKPKRGPGRPRKHPLVSPSEQDVNIESSASDKLNPDAVPPRSISPLEYMSEGEAQELQARAALRQMEISAKPNDSSSGHVAPTTADTTPTGSIIPSKRSIEEVNPSSEEENEDLPPRLRKRKSSNHRIVTSPDSSPPKPPDRPSSMTSQRSRSSTKSRSQSASAEQAHMYITDVYHESPEDSPLRSISPEGKSGIWTWKDIRASLVATGRTSRWSKDIPTDFHDRINAMSGVTKNFPGMRDLMQAYIREKTYEDEPDAPPITIVNNVDAAPTPPWEFYYSNHMWFGQGVDPPTMDGLIGCDCIGKCDPKNKNCACVKRQEAITEEFDVSDFVYDANKRLKKPQMPIFECNSLCRCDDSCQNRVVQLGRKVSVRLEKTALKGWGVFTNEKIHRGSYIGIYAGELLTESEGESRGVDYDRLGRTYLFNLDFWHLNTSADWDNKYVVDAFHAGNFTRFLNHSCDPNCHLTACYIDEPDLDRPLLTLFALKDIPANQELTFSYSGDVESDDDTPNSPKKKKKDDAVYAECHCGAAKCRKKLFS